MNKLKLIKTLGDRIEYLFECNEVVMTHLSFDEDDTKEKLDEMRKDFIELLKSNVWTIVLRHSTNEQVSEMN